ncbi:MAG TPA: periplasmic heavy metal sensor [Blastocatellia bacterium]|nr:periplasmic heavy metal sensor [Blastocatellia bacterium]
METSAKNKWQVRLAVLGIFLIGFVAGALTLNIYHRQQGPSSRFSMRGRIDRVIEQLELTPEQKIQVKEIFDDARAQLAEARKQSEPKFREVRRQTDERLRAVLTPEQWEKFQQMMKEGRGRRHGRRGGGESDDQQ